jgi:hypothetical protein
VATGVALLAATVVLSAVYSRARADLDGSNLVMGLAATIGLLGVAAAAWFLVTDHDRRDDLVAWPGAFGAVAAGLMVAVLMDDSGATGYVAGLVILAFAVGGYLLVRRGAFVVASIFGLLVFYLAILDDLFDATDVGGDNFGVTIGAAMLVFTILVTIGGWFLPRTRVLSAVVAGVIAVVSNAGVLFGLMIAAELARAFGGGFEVDGSPVRAGDFDRYDNDAWWLLVFSMLLVTGWAYLAYATGHVGFPLLMVAMSASVVPLVTMVLAAEHPTWWSVVVGVLGGLALVAAGLRATGRLRLG